MSERIDRIAYKRHIENKRIEMGVIETAEDRVARRKSIEFALGALRKGFPITDIKQVYVVTLPLHIPVFH